MKTYCKPKHVNIEDPALIARAVYKAFEGKLRRRDFRKLLIRTGEITEAEIDEALENADRRRVNHALDCLAEAFRRDIRDGALRIGPVHCFRRADGLSGKTRDLCKEGAYQQVCEYIAVEALMPLFRAKLLPCQYGSIPGRGQVAGVRKIEQIARRGKPMAAVKTDVSKAYPSTKVETVMRLLRRDIGKNKKLLRFLRDVMANYPNGALVIGGYLSTWLFNYVMSYVLRRMLAEGQTRRGKWKPFVRAIVSYADDTAAFGTKSGLVKAVRAAAGWARPALGLRVKDAWQFTRFASDTAEKRNQEARHGGASARTGRKYRFPALFREARKTVSVCERRAA